MSQRRLEAVASFNAEAHSYIIHSTAEGGKPFATIHSFPTSARSRELLGHISFLKKSLAKLQDTLQSSRHLESNPPPPSAPEVVNKPPLLSA